MAGHALSGMRRLRQLLMTLGLQPMADASLLTPPARLIARSSGFMPASLTYREAGVNTFREGNKSQAVDNGGMNFAANLRAIRNLRGMTQEEVAAACGWENATRVTNYESQSSNPRNRRKPDPDDILLLARALGVGVELLFSETPPESFEPAAVDSLSKRLDPRIIEHATMMAETLLGGVPFDPCKSVPLFIAGYDAVAEPSPENRARFDTALGARVAANGGGLERSADKGRGAKGAGTPS